MEKCNTGKVLVFSNSDEFVTPLCQMLSHTDYSVQGFRNRNEALEALKGDEFDVFIADAEMPEREGLALLRTAMRMNPHLFGIMISGQREGDLSAEAMQAGASDYITQPFKFEILLSEISRGIEVRNLRKAAEMYRMIFDSAVEGIYCKDADGRFVAANLALSNMLGYDSPNDLLTHLTDVGRELYVKPERHTLLHCMVVEEGVVSDFESQIYCKDKRLIWISENVRALRDKYGKILFFTGSVMDVTERKKMDNELRETMKHFRLLAEKNERDKEALHEIIEEMCYSYADFESSFTKFVCAVVSVIDGKIPWRKGHSVRVASYASKIGRKMGLDYEDLKKLRLSALLHDIGKIVDSDRLLDKPGKFSQEEFEQIKKHPVQGALILKKVKQLKEFIPIVRHHHERIDGQGYPDGLKGDAIPLISRILHVADSYDAMTVDRPHRLAPGRDFAFDELKRCSNTQFDPQVVDAAIKVL